MSQRPCHNDWCQTQHISNFSVGVQYGDEIPPTPCPCPCHLDEDNFHGEAARRANPKRKFIPFKKKEKL